MQMNQKQVISLHREADGMLLLAIIKNNKSMNIENRAWAKPIHAW